MVAEPYRLAALRVLQEESRYGKTLARKRKKARTTPTLSDTVAHMNRVPEYNDRRRVAGLQARDSAGYVQCVL